MKENICIVCLKAFSTSTTNETATAASPQQTEKCGVSLLTKFLKFAKNYLQIPSEKMLNVNGCASGKVSCSDTKDVFCEKCELAVITPICQVYLEFLSAQLRLSWELEQLVKLLDSSPLEKLDNDNKLGVGNIITLTEQLGIESVSYLEEFRSLLSQKCKLKRKLALPDVLIGPRCEHDDGVDDHHDVFEPLHSEGASNPIDFRLQEDGDFPLHENNGDGFFEIESVTVKLESVDLPNDDHYILPGNEDGKGDDDDENNSGVLDTLLKRSKCGSQFTTQFALDRHTDDECLRLSKQLKIEEVIVPEPLEEVEHLNVNKPPPRVHTPIPGNSVATNSPKRLNYNKRKRFSCSQCNLVFAQHGTLWHYFIAKHKPQTHVCSQCSKSFATLKYLKRHCMKVHPELAQFKCPVCAKGFATRFKMLDHKTYCSSTNNFSCPHCSVVYTTKGNLKYHIKAVHNPKIHVCAECNKAFATIQFLKRHCKTSHQQEYKCPICAKGFATRYKMLNHKQCHHNTKRFNCPQCSLVFPTNGHLKCHITAVHNPETHVCAKCNKVFTMIKYLKVHCAKVHPQPGQLEVACPICAKGFATRYKMLEHKRRYHKMKSRS